MKAEVCASGAVGIPPEPAAEDAPRVGLGGRCPCAPPGNPWVTLHNRSGPRAAWSATSACNECWPQRRAMAGARMVGTGSRLDRDAPAALLVWRRQRRPFFFGRVAVVDSGQDPPPSLPGSKSEKRALAAEEEAHMMRAATMQSALAAAFATAGAAVHGYAPPLPHSMHASASDHPPCGSGGCRAGGAAPPSVRGEGHFGHGRCRQAAPRPAGAPGCRDSGASCRHPPQPRLLGPPVPPRLPDAHGGTWRTGGEALSDPEGSERAAAPDGSNLSCDHTARSACMLPRAPEGNCEALPAGPGATAGDKPPARRAAGW